MRSVDAEQKMRVIGNIVKNQIPFLSAKADDRREAPNKGGFQSARINY